MKSISALRGFAALGLMLLAAVAHAVPDDGVRPVPPPTTRPTLEDLQRLVDAAMPADVKADNSALLAALLRPQAAAQGPSDVFDITVASRLLRLTGGVPGAGCTLPRPRFDCVVAVGTRGGGGAYKELRADSLGNLHYLSRLADPSGGNPENVTAPPLPTFTRSDADTVTALSGVLLNLFRVPATETLPTSRWRVEKMTVGIVDGDSRLPPRIQTVAGVVILPRLLRVEGLGVQVVPVIGAGAQAAIDDAGLFRVEVDDWTRFTMSSRLANATASSRSALVANIASALSRELKETPRAVRIGIAYAKSSDFSELGIGGDEQDAPPPTAAVMPEEHQYVPVLFTAIAPVAAEPTEATQAQAFSTGGMEMVTPLFELAD